MAKNKTANKPAKPKVSSRYTGIIVSIVIFLLFISALLALSFYSSRQISQNTARMNTAAEMGNIVQSMTKDLFNLKLSYGEDINSPHMKYTLNDLTEKKAIFNQEIQAFKQGGTVNSGGTTTNITKVTDPNNVNNVNTSLEAWQPLDGMINDYLKVANDVTADSTTLDLAVDYAQGASVQIYENLNELSDNIRQETKQNADLLQLLQAVGIAIAIVYFAIFIFYFMRKLRQSDKEAEAARRETTEIMETVSSGLFLLDKDLNIGMQHSKELENIIGQKEFAGKNLTDLLENMISEHNLETTKSFIGQLYNTRVKEKLVEDLNPLKKIMVNVMNPKLNTPEMRYLDFKFSRVYENQEINRILVNVSDVSDAVRLEKRLQQEREQNDLQIEMLSTILNADSKLINEFIDNTKKHIAAINNNLKTSGSRQHELEEKLSFIYREMHSLKGEASTLNLYGFTSIATAFEDQLKKLQNKPTLTGDDFLPLIVQLDDLISLTNTIEQLNQRIGNVASSKLKSLLDSDSTQEESNALTQHYTKFVADIAKRNNKKVTFNCQGVENDNIPENIQPAMREIAIQLLRNAVVHGIEAPSVRLQKQKAGTGNVQLTLAQNSNYLQLVVEDDGQGIDYAAIRRKAVESGKYVESEVDGWNNKQLLGLLFSSGFSTLSHATEDGGRGVGLDVIKDRVQQLKGKIKVDSALDKFTRFVILLPL